MTISSCSLAMALWARLAGFFNYFLGARLFLSGGDERHEHRPDREGVHLRLAGEFPQIGVAARK